MKRLAKKFWHFSFELKIDEEKIKEAKAQLYENPHYMHITLRIF